MEVRFRLGGMFNLYLLTIQDLDFSSDIYRY